VCRSVVGIPKDPFVVQTTIRLRRRIRPELPPQSFFGKDFGGVGVAVLKRFGVQVGEHGVVGGGAFAADFTDARSGETDEGCGLLPVFAVTDCVEEPLSFRGRERLAFRRHFVLFGTRLRTCCLAHAAFRCVRFAAACSSAAPSLAAAASFNEYSPTQTRCISEIDN